VTPITSPVGAIGINQAYSFVEYTLALRVATIFRYCSA